MIQCCSMKHRIFFLFILFIFEHITFILNILNPCLIYLKLQMRSSAHSVTAFLFLKRRWGRKSPDKRRKKKETVIRENLHIYSRCSDICFKTVFFPLPCTWWPCSTDGQIPHCLVCLWLMSFKTHIKVAKGQILVWSFRWVMLVISTEDHSGLLTHRLFFCYVPTKIHCYFSTAQKGKLQSFLICFFQYHMYYNRIHPLEPPCCDRHQGWTLQISFLLNKTELN